MDCLLTFGRGINFEIRTPDIEVLIQACRANNYPIYQEVTESWRDIGISGKEFGSREFLVHDPDGYELRFAQVLAARNIS